MQRLICRAGPRSRVVLRMSDLTVTLFPMINMTDLRNNQNFCLSSTSLPRMSYDVVTTNSHRHPGRIKFVILPGDATRTELKAPH
jgi:hypothetical protein